MKIVKTLALFISVAVLYNSFVLIIIIYVN